MLYYKRQRLVSQFHYRDTHSAKSVSIRSRLTYEEISKLLALFDFEVTAATLERLYKASPLESGLTLSQLQSRTEEYFVSLSSPTKISEAEKSMELKGMFLGCRKGTKTNTGTACHDLLPGGFRQPAGSNPQQTLSMRAPCAWKSRWLDKTLEKPEKKLSLR